MKNLPQEIEMWYLIPSLRKELARIFVEEYKLNQKAISTLLGITEATVSHYINEQRGQKIKFAEEEIILIKKSAENMIKKKSSYAREICSLCDKFRKSKFLCRIHRNFEKNISKDCDICFGK
jgi:hypothetical protein